jgi:hypothetical protein
MTNEERQGFGDAGEIFSRPVKAGKRTYFFDVKATKGNDYYLTITESKKRFGDDGRFHYEKHKLFLYKEDFDKFADGLHEVINFIKNRNATLGNGNGHENGNAHHETASHTESHSSEQPVTTDVSFDDLGSH